MVDIIEIKKKHKSIPVNFQLADLKDFNIIIGENGVGKTNLFEAIEREYSNDENVLVVYVRAGEVRLSEYAKVTADSSGVVKQNCQYFKIKAI